MKDLIKQYMDGGVSRRNFLSSLGALGITSVAANSMARSLAPFSPPADDSAADGAPAWMREVRGTGGALLVAQLKAAGIEYIFFNPSSGEAPIYDALSRPGEKDVEFVEILPFTPANRNNLIGWIAGRCDPDAICDRAMESARRHQDATHSLSRRRTGCSIRGRRSDRIHGALATGFFAADRGRLPKSASCWQYRTLSSTAQRSDGC